MSIFPTKILLATDGSKDAVLAARTAIELCNDTDSELHVVTVGQLAPHYDAWGKALSRAIKQEARRSLDEQVKRIENVGGTIMEAHLRLGREDDEIVALAQEIGAGLIVIGSRGLGGIRRALMGSVSVSVVRHAHCPVMVVRAGENEESIFPLRKRILLGTDGSEEAEIALRTAIELASGTNSELHVLTVGGEYHPGVEIRGPLRCWRKRFESSDRRPERRSTSRSEKSRRLEGSLRRPTFAWEDERTGRSSP